MTLTLAEWGAAEAKRLLDRKQRGMTPALCAQAGARRAPGIMAGAQALRTLLHSGDADVKQGIPANVRAEVVANAALATDAECVSRVAEWLRSCPYELSRCNTVLAALAAVAPVAVRDVQDPLKRNEALEEEVARVAGIKKRNAPKQHAIEPPEKRVHQS
jgi:hypothetical protein